MNGSNVAFEAAEMMAVRVRFRDGVPGRGEGSAACALYVSSQQQIAPPVIVMKFIARSCGRWHEGWRCGQPLVLTSGSKSGGRGECVKFKPEFHQPLDGVLAMLDRVSEFRHGYPAHEDDDLSSAIEALEARISRLERQIAEEGSAFLASMMRGVLAEVTTELDGLKAEWASRTGR